MISLEFETNLRIGDKTIDALFAGKFEFMPDGEIDEIIVKVWSPIERRFSGTMALDGPLFELMKATLEHDYADQIEDAREEWRDSRAASKADRERDAAVAA